MALAATLACRPAPEAVAVAVADGRAREPVGCDNNAGKPRDIDQWYAPTLPGCIARISDPMAMMIDAPLLADEMQRGLAWMASEPRVRGVRLSQRVRPADLSQLRRLRYLDIITPWPEEVAMLPGLAELEFLDVKRWDACDASDGLAGLPGLRGLGIWGCGRMTGWGVMRRLERLDLTRVELADLQMLAGLTGLQELNIIASQIAEPSIPAPGLRRLQLHGSVSYEGSPISLRVEPAAGRVPSYDLRALSGLQALEELALFNANAFTHGEVLVKLPALRRLATHDAGLLPQVARMGALERLDLRRAVGVRPRDLRFLGGRGARRLTHLALPGVVVAEAVEELVAARWLRSLVVASRGEPATIGAVVGLRMRRPDLEIVVSEHEERDLLDRFPALYEPAVDPWR